MVLLPIGETLELEAREEHLFLFAQTAYGEIDDAIKLEGAKEHNAITVNIDPNLLRKGLDGRNTMVVTENCLVMNGPKEFFYIVATKS